MKITIEIWEEGEGVIVAHARTKAEKKMSEDVRRYSAMVCAAIKVMLPMVSEEFARKKATEEVGAWLMKGKAKVKKKRNVKSNGVVV